MRLSRTIMSRVIQLGSKYKSNLEMWSLYIELQISA